jgi:hypothetical protein
MKDTPAIIGIRINRILVTFQRIIANEYIPGGAFVVPDPSGSIALRSTIKLLLFTSVDPTA